MNPIIAIEGISFSGKTTLTRRLEQEGYVRLYELAERFGNGAGFPPFPKTNDQANASDEWFLCQEVIRTSQAQERARDSTVVADRCFISGLNFAYARRSVFDLGENSHQHQTLLRYVKSGELFVPWLVYLRTDVPTYFRRKKQDERRRVKEFGKDAVDNVTVWKHEEEFVAKQVEHYDRIFANIRACSLEVDAQESTEDIARRIKEWISRLPMQKPTSSVDALLIVPEGAK